MAGAFQRLYAANTIGAILGHGDRGLRADRAARAHGRARSSARCARRPPASIALLLDRRARAPSARRRRRRPTPAPRRGRVRRDPTALRRSTPPTAGAVARARCSRSCRAHVARLPGRLEPAARRRDRQLDLRVHDHPGAVPGRHRGRRGAARRPAAPGPPTTLLIATAQVADRAVRARRRRGPRVAAGPVQRCLGRLHRRAAGLRVVRRVIVLPPTIIMGLTFPATAALLGDETGTEGVRAGRAARGRTRRARSSPRSCCRSS